MVKFIHHYLHFSPAKSKRSNCVLCDKLKIEQLHMTSFRQVQRYTNERKLIPYSKKYWEQL